MAACSPAAKPDTSQAQTSSIDSLVLERTVCFGLCPAYRLRISSAEQIRFESRNRGDSATIVIDTAPRGTLASLVARARAIGFYELPSDIRKDPALCANWATDMPTVTTTIFSGSTTKQVSHYHGCVTVDHEVPPPLKNLRAFEDQIDSTLHSSRWVRPNGTAK